MHTPQPPLRHSKGMGMPARSPASRTVSSGRTRISLLPGCTVMRKPWPRARRGGSQGSSTSNAVEASSSAHTPVKRPRIHQWKGAEDEPVEAQIVGDHAQIRRRVTYHRQHQGQHDQRDEQRQGDGARRIGRGARHTLDVDPHEQQQGQRHADVDEREQREQPVLDAALVDEVAHQRTVEDRQPVQELGRADHDELGQPIPGQHVAVDAGDVSEPQQQHAAHPGEPAKAAMPVEAEVPQHVQQHGDDHAVGGISVQAAHDRRRRTSGRS